MLPDTLVNFNLFVEGVGYAGRVSELKLPKIAKKVIEVFNGGMAAPVEVAVGYEKIESEFTLQGVHPAVMKMLANNQLNGVPLRMVGTYHNPNSQGGTYDLEINLTGTIKEMDAGGYKRGEQPATKYMHTAAYYRVDVDGEPAVEIDAMKPFEATE